VTDLPDRLPFPQLLEQAKENPHPVLVRDPATGIDGTSAQLLESVIQVRDELRIRLDSDTLSRLDSGSDDVFIFLLFPPGWNYIVSVLAVFALGGAVMPIRKSQHCPRELVYAKVMKDPSIMPEEV
jgi:malonyl-CoA/methylmalonyl-CoA synthetase